MNVLMYVYAGICNVDIFTLLMISRERTQQRLCCPPRAILGPLLHLGCFKPLVVRL